MAAPSRPAPRRARRAKLSQDQALDGVSPTAAKAKAICAAADLEFLSISQIFCSSVFTERLPSPGHTAARACARGGRHARGVGALPWHGGPPHPRPASFTPHQPSVCLMNAAPLLAIAVSTSMLGWPQQAGPKVPFRKPRCAPRTNHKAAQQHKCHDRVRTQSVDGGGDNICGGSCCLLG